MNGITIQSKIHFRRGRRSKKELCDGAEKPPAPAGVVPRISRLMALAIRFEQLVQDGVVPDYAALARLGHVTRARMTQLMNLLNLAPEIQEGILFLPLVERGRAPITERDLRPIASVPDWRKQRNLWSQVIQPQ